ncbi:hypothetical protein PGT21_006282 [Puccinia graminis f. sp. tritici]|uniref:Chitin-binding type-2 domain-containing protein n=1 Tax=Puccinia graminis f. sp. tritici TaxID=56615 RepID=A0A5B0PG84_PUCGR|nr:hypothetical protein PGT21_006282 [Puccinia graminis f. sp. tritici]
MQFHASRYLLVAGSLFISQVMSQVILETCGKNECTGKLEIISQQFGTCEKIFKCDAGEYHDECGTGTVLSYKKCNQCNRSVDEEKCIAAPHDFGPCEEH